MEFWKIRKLQSGGVITNYHCVSSCRHCLYNCHPKRDKAYLTPQRATTIFSHIRRKGCSSIHLGGGEPMLRPNALQSVLESAKRSRMEIDYVETNAAWYKDLSSAVSVLNKLKKSGLRALLVSISPFHNEYIPLSKTMGVMEAANATGIHIIPWIDTFFPILSQLDDSKPHSFDEFEVLFGDNPLVKIKAQYWIHFGGRALNTYRPYMKLFGFEALMASGNCLTELTHTQHFHVDLYGQYIPGLCSGLAIPMKYIGQPLDQNRFPLLTRLAIGGVQALAEWAQRHFGYMPLKSGYINKCDLCTEIRTFIACHDKGEQPLELHPIEFYGAGDCC